MSTVKVDTLVASDGTSPVTLTKQSASKAWIDFAGDGSSINGSFNVASLTDNATGDYTPNFSSSMSNANYAITTSGALRPSDSGLCIVLQIRNILGIPTLKTTSAIRIDGKRSDSDTNLDIGTGCSSVNGDLA
jgi:hypothetical protein